MKPWAQFFNLEGDGEKPFGTVRDITVRNVDVKCKSFGIMEGKPDDRVSSITFSNVHVQADSDTFRDAYQEETRMENVTINGKPIKYKD